MLLYILLCILSILYGIVLHLLTIYTYKYIESIQNELKFSHKISISIIGYVILYTIVDNIPILQY